MKRSIRIAVLGLAGVGVLVLASLAIAAYTSPKLQVSYAGSTTIITASAATGDDATARSSIFVPTGTTLTTTQAPGTNIGTVKAQVTAAALGGALLPLEGPIVVAPPGAVPAATQLACTQGATPIATWLLQLSAAGQTINLPAYVIPTAGAQSAFGPAEVRFCIAAPVVNPANTFGAKFISAALTLNGVFSAVTQGAWVALWTPWAADNSAPNPAGTVASPAAVAAGAVTAKAKKLGTGALVTGRVTQGGVARPGTAVAIWGAKGRAALRRLGSTKTSAAGTFSFRARNADVFQARVVAGSISAPPLCTLLTAQLQGIPCVNPTANGFTAKSGLVRRK
jgi:hypothetical protein